jgi:hypothetical protein
MERFHVSIKVIDFSMRFFLKSPYRIMESLTFIYGFAFLLLFIILLRQFYSVYYTPGVTTLYNTPVVQKLFPQQKGKLAPLWGYNKIGTISSDNTKYGQDDFWPEDGQGYRPTKSGSGGAHPMGGERNTKLPFSEDLELGWWNGDYSYQTNTAQSIYDSRGIPEKMVVDVGHWST